MFTKEALIVFGHREPGYKKLLDALVESGVVVTFFASEATGFISSIFWLDVVGRKAKVEKFHKLIESANAANPRTPEEVDGFGGECYREEQYRKVLTALVKSGTVLTAFGGVPKGRTKHLDVSVGGTKNNVRRFNELHTS